MEIRVDPYIRIFPRPDNSIVRLREKEGKNRAIDITLSPVSLYNLFTIINRTDTGRPIIHQVMVHTLSKLGLDIERVVIDDLVNGKFHSHIYVKSGGQVHSIDTHVPDAIGLSVIQNCPLLILEDLFDKAAEYQAKHQTEMSDQEAMRILENFDPGKGPKN